MECNSNNNKYWLNMKLLDMPLVINTGYNSFYRADPLSWHNHNGFELTFVTKGKAVWELYNGNTYSLSRNSICLTAPNIQHRGIDNITHPCDMFWIVFNPYSTNALHNTVFTRDELNNVAMIFKNVGNAVVNSSPFLDSLLKEYRHYLINYNYNDLAKQKILRPFIRGLLCQIIIQSSYCFKEGHLIRWSPATIMAYQFIQKHFKENIKIEDIADHIGKSTTYLYNIFKKETGQTPNEFIQQLRIECACKLLRETLKPVTEIAFDVGFSSSQYFANVFKRYIGRSPSDFRKEIFI